MIEFLLARIAEDEAVARDWPDVVGPPPDGHAFWADPQGRAIYEPRTRVLAECEAKRAIVEHHGSNGDEWPLCVICTEVGPDAQGWPCLTLQLLALPYSDHPDYRDEWRP